MAKILAIDDNTEILEVIDAVLSLAGFEVTSTPSPDQGIQLAAAQGFDAVVLDIMMPGISGYQVLARLRELPGGEHLPVLFLSARTEAEDRVRGLRLGADDYLTKPFVADELVLRVERLVRGKTRQRPGLEGDLHSMPLTSLVQTLSDEGQSGMLEVTHGGQRGALRFVAGRMVDARFGHLEGREAAMALVDLAAGRFRFTPGTAPPRGAGPTPGALEWQATLLEAAWTADELKRRSSFMPAPTGLFRLSRRPLSRVPSEFTGLPIRAVHQLVEQGEVSRLDQLLHRELAAPQRVRLALAWLIEHGVVERWGEKPPAG